MIVIEPVNDVWLRVSCEESIARELHDYFSFEVAGAHFVRRTRPGWSGRIHLFKLRGYLLYRGLLTRLIQFADERELEVVNNIPEPIAKDFDALYAAVVKELPFEPDKYQQAAVRDILTRQRGLLLSPTGSGKSMIQYLIIRMLRKRTLVVVPNIGLVTQMKKHFIEYGCPAEYIQTIKGGESKDVQCPIVISTWQSIYELLPTWFENFKCVIVDEVHGAKAKSLTGLLEKCLNIPYRIGCTGTLDDTASHRLVLEGLFGTVFKVTTTKQLIKDKRLTPLRVKMCVIQYPEATRKQWRRAQYKDEMDFLVTDPARLELVARLALKVKGNVLVLFNFVEKHGKPLYQRIIELDPTREVHYVSGETDADSREAVRQLVDQGDNQIIVASYGTFSTGINIPKLDTLILASPSKSKIRVLQSIGRTLRTHASKTVATLIDIVDDMRIGKYVNHSFRHAEQRVQYYMTEEFPFTQIEQDMEVWLHYLEPSFKHV